MHYLGKFLLPVVILGVAIFGAMALMSFKQPPATTTPGAIIPNVTVEPVDRNVDVIDIHVNGNVMPRREIRIAAEVAGRIIEKGTQIRAGRFVEEGTELCRIDREPYQLELQRLDNELKQADVDLQQLTLEEENTEELIALAQEDLGRANRDLERLEQARTQSRIADIITETQFDEARGEITRMKNALQTLQNTKSLIPTRRERLQAQKSLTETRKKIAQLDLDRSTVIAPISGVIATESIEEGDFVQRGTELVIIEDVSQMEVSCNLLTEDLYWMWASSPSAGRTEPRSGARDYYQVPDISATISLTVAQQVFEWDGKLSRLEGSSLHQKTRTVPCRVLVEEPKSDRFGVAPPSLARGMFVSVTLHVPAPASLLRIPEEALRMNGRVYTAVGETDPKSGERISVLHIHTVRVARSVPGAVIVREDSVEPPISPGAQLVVSPLQYATDGMQIKIAAAPDESNSPERDTSNTDLVPNP